MKPRKWKRKRPHDESEIIDLTKDEEETEQHISKKYKVSSSSVNQAVAPTSSERQRWIQMGWKPGKKHGLAPAPASTPSAPPKYPKSQKAAAPSAPPAPAPPSFPDLPSADVFSHPSDQFRQKFQPDPNNFHSVADSLCVPVEEVEAVRSAGNWSRLTADITRLFNSSQQQRRLLDRKIFLWKKLLETLHQEMECGLAVSGSTFNGFGGSGADLDMCLYPHGPALSDQHWLTMARTLLRKKCKSFIRGDIQLIKAKVPILKFYDCVGRLEVDLSVNNPTSARNTHLLYCYSQLDYRVRPLVLCIKRWAKNNQINEARLQTLSSYSLSLMVIHYLQAGVTPPVLPCLQKTQPGVFNCESDIFNLPYTAQPLPSNNTDPLGKLFVGFFKYYTTPNRFNTLHDVASVREGRKLRREDCEHYSRVMRTGPGQWSAHLLIEEPFDRTNAARAVCSLEKWNLIKAVFNATMDRIESKDISSLCLEDFNSRNIRIGRYL